ncbi:hypothetical protein P171DRAFT_278232 [Karstenula rhodostoma CBS 690.94]|uniref:Uncharacterized protein n=1 Tax=Karstenula rhodostoma CBS 690.94 TaxID=1392251 RepID=A0A9P4UBV7_9PLEO|nr:hypothetical protein P171DRAFT_278232 [Karstenula rhodostoma CBS 690.94]
MEPLQGSLEAILQAHFSIVPARTNRHDQWYKRSYQSWKSEHGDREPVILAPRTSRDEWTRKLYGVAIEFATIVDQGAENIHRYQDSAGQTPQNNLFADNVLEIPLGYLGLECAHTFPLKPAMQRISYWSESSMKTDDER